jgi:hypothetical protein
MPIAPFARRLDQGHLRQRLLLLFGAVAAMVVTLDMPDEFARTPPARSQIASPENQAEPERKRGRAACLPLRVRRCPRRSEQDEASAPRPVAVPEGSWLKCAFVDMPFFRPSFAGGARPVGFQCRARARTSAMTSVGSSGFSKCAWKPARSMFTRSCGRARPVTAIAAMPSVASVRSARSCRMNS